MLRSSIRGFLRLTAGLLALAPLTSGCGAKSSSAPMGPTCPADDDVLSDFNTDNGLHKVDGRQGGWYTYGGHTGFGMLTPAEGSGAQPDKTEGNPNCSMMGATLGAWHVKALGDMDWGAATGVDFVPKVATDAGLSVKGTYDARKYRGVSFWAKSAPASTTVDATTQVPVRFVQVKFLDPYTEFPSVIPQAEWCAYMAGKPQNCSPYIVKFGYGYTGTDLPPVVADYPKYKDYAIDTTWKRFEVLFADTKQDQFNAGLKSPGDKLDVSQLMGMAIQVNSDHSDPAMPKPNNFEIWIDDVAFVK
jgi:hypothetical protein